MTLKTKMEKLINSSYNNIAGIIVRRNDTILYEKYFNECNADSPIHVFSVTKSIISILIGIAIDKGYIQSVDQYVLDFYPEYTLKRGEKTIQDVTLKNLLTMTAPYKYKAEPYTEYFTSHNWVESALNLLGGRGKIGVFRYTPVIGPDILSGILVNATGQSILDFATKFLFKPLGITVGENVIFQNKEEQLAFYKDRNVRGWVADPTGVNTAGWGLTLTPMDMSKIGQLYLDGGQWKGQQIVSTEWIKESIKEHSRWERLSYGYLWWVIDEEEHAYAAMGDGENVIYINTKKELVVSIASLYVPHAKDRLKLIQEYIEPVFEEYV